MKPKAFYYPLIQILEKLVGHGIAPLGILYIHIKWVDPYENVEDAI